MTSTSPRWATHVARDAGALTAGTIVSGVAAYAYAAIGTRAFGAGSFAPVSILWTFWTFSVAALTFPLQHWVIREIEAGRERNIRTALPRVAAAVTGVSAVLTLVTAVFRAHLFHADGLTYPLLVGVITLGSGLLGILRGTLAGRRRYTAAGVLIGSENIVRLAGGVAVILLDGGPELFGATLALGPLVALLWPDALRLPSGGQRRVSGSRIIASAGFGNLVAQVILVGAPVVVIVLNGDPASVTSLFAALALFRAPYVVALGMLVRATGPVTRAVEDGRTSSVRRGVGWAMASTVGLAAVFAAGAGTVGQPVLRLVFGATVVLPTAALAWAAVANAAALGGLAFTVVLIARDDGRAIGAAWATALAAGVIAAAVWPGGPLARAVAGFVCAELVATTATGWAASRSLS